MQAITREPIANSVFGGTIPALFHIDGSMALTAVFQ